MSAADQLRALLDDLYAAFSSGDPTAWTAHLADDVIGIGSDPDEWWEGRSVFAQVVTAQMHEISSALTIGVAWRLLHWPRAARARTTRVPAPRQLRAEPRVRLHVGSMHQAFPDGVVLDEGLGRRPAPRSTTGLLPLVGRHRSAGVAASGVVSGTHSYSWRTTRRRGTAIEVGLQGALHCLFSRFPATPVSPGRACRSRR